MKYYTFQHGNFQIPVYSENEKKARVALQKVLNIIIRQIAFSQMPTVKDFNLINIQETI